MTHRKGYIPEDPSPVCVLCLDPWPCEASLETPTPAPEATPMRPLEPCCWRCTGCQHVACGDRGDDCGHNEPLCRECCPELHRGECGEGAA